MRSWGTTVLLFLLGLSGMVGSGAEVAVPAQLQALLSSRPSTTNAAPPIAAGATSTTIHAASTMPSSTTNRNAASLFQPSVVQSLGSSIISATLQQFNGSGVLPSVTALNDLLLQNGNGLQPLQILDNSNSTSFDVAQVMSLFGNASSEPITAEMRANTAVPRPPGSTSSLQLPDILSLLGANPAAISTTSTPASVTFARDLDNAQRAVRFGMYDALYGYLEFAGYQISAIGFWLQLAQMDAAADALFAVGDQILALGYLFEGIRGGDELSVAIRELNELMQQQTETAAVPTSTATESVATTSGSINPVFSTTSAIGIPSFSDDGPDVMQDVHTLRSLILDANPDLPSTNFNTQPVKATDTAMSSTAEATLGLPCPAFLFASWQRVETDMSGEAASAATSPDSGEEVSVSLLLRFTRTSYERLETTISAGKQRVRSQRWDGALQVDCEWSLLQQPGNVSSPFFSSVAPLSPISSGLQSLQQALSAPQRQLVNVTVRVVEPCQRGAASFTVDSLHFSYSAQNNQDGSKLHVLVDQNADGEGRRRAYLRL